MTGLERLVDTPRGPARVTTRAGDGPGVLVLGHGAGGLSWTADVLAVAEAAHGLGWTTHLVDQPWRVLGKRLGPSGAGLDEAWLAVVADLDPVGPLVVGGRSAGARVAARTAGSAGAAAVLALSFPLHPPGRPERSRASELRAPLDHGCAMVVVQGTRDPFGTPSQVRAELPAGMPVVEVAAAHSLGAVAEEVAARSADWLQDAAGGLGGR